MSNATVGSIYKKIIDAVVDVSRTDFEENGVSNDVLQLLQEKWQDRLSETARASFPWDPPQPQAVQAPTPAPSMKSEAISNSSTLPSPASQHNSNGIQIKQEPNYDQSYLNLPNNATYTSGLGQPQYAHQRAAQLLQNKFGSQATGSISAIQAAQMGLPGAQQQRPQTAQSAINGQQASLQQQQQAMQQRMSQTKQENPYIKQEGNQSSLGLAQTDGAGDVAESWNSVLMERMASVDEGATGRIAVDGMIRHHVEAMAQRLEAGGLMVPLDERRKARRTLQSRAGPSSSASRTLGPSRFDGGGDDDDAVNDDDAINSDLDDSEDDELEGNIETDFQGDVILCLYDKVQRVKNKWKCTLKDGVVTVDGKDYVFHKAQGEFEW